MSNVYNIYICENNISKICVIAERKTTLDITLKREDKIYSNCKYFFLSIQYTRMSDMKIL